MVAYHVFRAVALLLGFALLVCVPVGLFLSLVSAYVGMKAVLAAGALAAALLLGLARSFRLRVGALRMVGTQVRR
jgi:hypothetical protein